MLGRIWFAYGESRSRPGRSTSSKTVDRYVSIFFSINKTYKCASTSISCVEMSADATVFQYFHNVNGLFTELQKNPLEGFSAGLVDDEDIYKWEVLIIGPADTF